QLVGRVRRLTTPTVIALDFAGTLVATGSFLRESILGFRDFCRRSQPNLYPVVANLNETVEEELLDLLQSRREALVACLVAANGDALSPRVLGILEEKQRVTLDAVLSLGEADAATLTDRLATTEKIGVTGWNNRLSSLVAAGILMEVRSGRGKRYRPIL